MPVQLPRRSLVLLLTLAFGLVACDAGRGSPSFAVDPGSAVPTSLQGLAVTTVAIGSLELDVAVAETPEHRAAGLTGVEDLGPLDGLLFVFPAEVDTTFTMRGVPIALDIAFVDGGRRVLAVESMAVCRAEPCPSYASPGPYRWAVETPAGKLADVAPGDAFAIRP